MQSGLCLCGGKISKCDYVEPDANRLVKSTISKPAELMTLSYANCYFAEKTKRKKRKQKPIDINKDLIPDELKHLTEIKDE